MPNPESQDSRYTWARKASVLLIVGVAMLVGFSVFGQFLSLDKLAEHESEFRSWQQSQPALVYGAAFLIYVAITGLSLPGATILSLMFGWYFGLWKGVVLVSFSSTTGATLAFLLARYLLRDTIQNRFGSKLRSFNKALERDGPFFLFTLRLIPAIPFFVINAVMGLTPIRTRTFWWVSQLGMLPATVIYIYAGSSVPNLQALSEEGIGAVFNPVQLTQIATALALLGIFPLLVRFARNWSMRSDGLRQ